MESNDLIEESSDSIPQPEFEILDTNCVTSAGEIAEGIENLIEPYSEEESRSQSHYNDDDDDDDDENDEDYDEDLEEEDDEDFDEDASICTTPSSIQPSRISKGKKQQHEDNEVEEICSKVLKKKKADKESTNLDIRDNLIVQDEGMIKKIKLTHLPAQKASSETSTPLTNKKTQPRSSTPMSRDYLALQKSINESKILTEFVTDTELEKPRKLRTKETIQVSTAATEHSYSTQQKRNSNTSPSKEAIHEKTKKQHHKRSSSNSTEKNPRKKSYSDDDLVKRCPYNKYYVPLKDTDVEPSADSGKSVRRPSRSRSMSTSANNSKQQQKLKKWPSEEKVAKRSNMRSENSEFVQKQKDFLQLVISSEGVEMDENPRKDTSTDQKTTLDSSGGGGSIKKEKRTRSSTAAAMDNDQVDRGIRVTQDSLFDTSDLQTNPDDESVISMAADSHSNSDLDSLEMRLKSIWQPAPKLHSDSFCWKCHDSDVDLCCTKCCRSFHSTCLKISSQKLDSSWLCIECSAIEQIINNYKRSRRTELPQDLLSQLLSFALKRMRLAKGYSDFVMPHGKINPKYIINPVTFASLENKIDSKEYRFAEEFVNDSKWMLHNAMIISGGNNTKAVVAAKSILKVCRQEAIEIETCAECYLNAHTRTDWFVDVCSHPHLLLWAKLKGFPYWPAKAMGIAQNSSVNVRFFGEHDRAFVPLKDCYLYSEQDPNNQTGKRTARDLADCIKEVEKHIGKIKAKIGDFKYAAFKTFYDPIDEMRQLEEMMPGVQEFINRQQGISDTKPSLQFKIYKTADNHLSIVQKASSCSSTPTTPEQLSHPSENEETDGNRKKKAEDIVNSEDKSLATEDPIAIPESTPKYEVISKVISDDSNSSKLSTVILKRKSVNSCSGNSTTSTAHGNHKTASGEERQEDLPLPKMIKILTMSQEQPTTAKTPCSGKRKLRNSETSPDVSESTIEQEQQQPNLKCPKILQDQQKVPVLTIKTASITTISNETKNDQESAELAEKSQVSLTLSPAMKVMEDLVKNKQGVTIKKLTNMQAANPNEFSDSSNKTKSNNSEDPKSNDKNNANVTPPPPPQQTEHKQKANQDEEKDKEAQKVNNILKGLVPFVEIKKEVLSDNEAEEPRQASKSQVDKSPINANPAKSTTNPSSSQAEHDSQKKTQTNTEILAPVQIKEEVLSDEEMNNPSNQINTANATSAKDNSETATLGVRVVGGTTIKKLPQKTAQLNVNINSLGNVKRNPLRGIPYGPLPATALSKQQQSSSSSSSSSSTAVIQTNESDSKTAQQTKTIQAFTAKTSLIHNATNNCTKISQNHNTITHKNSMQLHLDPKRTLHNTTMVAIPVDVASTSRAGATTSSVTTTTIPMPPLTAVSKTLSTSQPVINTISRISPNTTSSSLITSMAKPSNTTLTSSTTNARNSPVMITTSAQIQALPAVVQTQQPPAAQPSALPAQPPPTSSSSSSSLNPLTLTTPPPLAGLSGANLLASASVATPPVAVNSHQQVNESPTSSSSCTPSSSTPTAANTADTHLLGGLVTPSLASAITEVICRGPPILAARPTGPLQSDGYPMFPSQAGPVSKRLMGNVHKLTDFFISVVEDTMGEIAQEDEGSLQAKLTLVTLELERTKQTHDKEITELKRTSDLMLCEMRKNMENEKTRLANEIRKQCELEKIQAVQETKRKQWCAQCGREANFYCCWNTSYCDYPCQQLHWARHAVNCAQTRPIINETTPTQIMLASSSTTSSNSAPSSSQVTKPANERIYLTKSHATSSSSAITTYNKTTVVHNKKERTLAPKITLNSTLPLGAATSTVAAATRSNAEVLKLPSNTYLRPVTATTNGSTTHPPQQQTQLRSNTTYSIPVQRYNGPLPVTPHVSSNYPAGQTFTLVQQGNNWVMSSKSSALLNSNNNSPLAANSSIVNASTAAAGVSVTPKNQQQLATARVNPLLNNKATKAQIRYH